MTRAASWCSLRTAVAAGVLAVALTVASWAQAPEVRLAAIPEFVTVAPGTAVRVAVRIDVPTGWHIGWMNTGESGLPTTLTWREPPDFSPGGAVWPVPEWVEDASRITHILRDTVYVLTPFTVAPAARAGRAELTADLMWAVCSEGHCYRQHGSVRAVVRVDRGLAGRGVAGGRNPAWAPVAAAAGALPLAGEGIILRASAVPEGVRLEISGLSEAPPAGAPVMWFPAAEGQTALRVTIRVARGTVSLTVRPRDVTGAPPGRLVGVLAGLLVRQGTATSRALTVDVPVEPAAR